MSTIACKPGVSLDCNNPDDSVFPAKCSPVPDSKCVALNCSFPTDLELYSLDGLQFFLNGQYYFVLDCPPGYDCLNWPVPWGVPPGALPPIYLNDMPIRLMVCNNQYVTATVPKGASQAEAAAIIAQVYAQAAKLEATCNAIKYTGAKPKPRQQLFKNQQYIAVFQCKPGSLYQYTFPAGRITASTQSQADSIAVAQGDALAQTKYICFGDIASNGCSGTAYDVTAVTQLGPAADGPFAINNSAGTIPPGLSIQQIGAASFRLFGTPSTPGNYTFTIKGTDFFGNIGVRIYHLSILGLDTSVPLPTATEGQAYNTGLIALGGTPPYTFSISPFSAKQLPSGLTMSGAGVITGTVDYMTADVYPLTVIISDSTGNTCSQVVNMTVQVAPGPDWTQLAGGAVAHVGGGVGNIATFSGAGRSWSGAIQYPVFTGAPPYVDTLSASFFHTGAGANCRLNFIFSGCSGTTSGSINIYVNGFLVGAFAGPQGNGTRTFNFAVPAGVGIPITINTTAGQGLIAIDQFTPGAANLLINVFNL